MRRLFRALFTLFLIAVVGIGIFSFWLRWAERPADPEARERRRITVSSGSSAASVGRELERVGLIRSARVFSFLSHGLPIRPGVYDVSAAETPGRILRHLVHGDFATVRVVIPEGFTVAQIAHRLLRLGAINDENAFLALVTTQGSTLHASVSLPENLEGYLFPDTYRLPVGASDREIAQEMVGTFDRRVTRPKAAEIRASGRSLADIVNVASMVEREAETDGDRAPIAGVIYNRIARHMHLEIDATVQYAQGFHKTRLLYRDLTIDSPYNTYRVAGLPPTAICNPGLPSIEAAIRPARSDYLFYVAKPGGAHVFARTFAEHEHNVAVERKAFRLERARATPTVETP